MFAAEQPIAFIEDRFSGLADRTRFRIPIVTLGYGRDEAERQNCLVHDCKARMDRKGGPRRLSTRQEENAPRPDLARVRWARTINRGGWGKKPWNLKARIQHVSYTPAKKQKRQWTGLRPQHLHATSLLRAVYIGAGGGSDATEGRGRGGGWPGRGARVRTGGYGRERGVVRGRFACTADRGRVLGGGRCGVG